MSKSIIINDTHMCVRNSSDIFINYQDAFYTHVMFPYMKENGIEHVIHAGDYAEHRKHLNVKGVTANREHFLDPLAENGYTMDIVPGNHDTYFKNTNRVNSLDILFAGYDNVTIHHEPTQLQLGDTKLSMIPWISPDNYGRVLEYVKNDDATHAVGHFEFSGFEMYPGQYSMHGTANVSDYSKYELVMSGHFHKKSQRGNVMYLGSQLEFTWSDVDDPKYFHVLDWETGNVEAVRIPLTIYRKVVYNDELFSYENYNVEQFDYNFVKVVVEKKSDPYLFDKFIERIEARPVHDLKVDELFNEYSGENVADIEFKDTSELLNEYVDGVDTPLDKDRLKTVIHRLLVEAQSIEIQ